QKLHPPHSTSTRRRQITTIIRLDLVDPSQHLPRHVVLNPRRLINRQQKRRNPKTIDKEIRHPNRRRTRQRERERRVGRRRDAARASGLRGLDVLVRLIAAAAALALA